MALKIYEVTQTRGSVHCKVGLQVLLGYPGEPNRINVQAADAVVLVFQGHCIEFLVKHVRHWDILRRLRAPRNDLLYYELTFLFGEIEEMELFKSKFLLLYKLSQ